MADGETAGDAGPGGRTVASLAEALDLIESLPPAGPALREQGYDSEADLIGGLDDPDVDVRRGCLELLDDAWTDEAAPAVVARLDDPEWVVRYYAVHALVRGVRPHRPRTGSVVVPAVIRTVSSDSSTYVRMLATEVVGHVADDDRDAAEALTTVRDTDAEPAVRRKAARYVPA